LGAGVKISELKHCCSLYAQQTTFDDTLKQFLSCVAPGFDPMLPRHRECLLRWLNKWKCRQFKLSDHGLASSELADWAKTWPPRLPAPAEHLTDLPSEQLRTCAEAYEALSVKTASRRRYSDGRTAPVSYGDTGASKTLFALRPNVAAPWDAKIREGLQHRGIRSYRDFLGEVADQLRSLAREAGVEVHELPRVVGRPRSSPPKLIDEYNWVVYTARLYQPRVR
jgi:hypothetical protein